MLHAIYLFCLLLEEGEERENFTRLKKIKAVLKHRGGGGSGGVKEAVE